MAVYDHKTYGNIQPIGSDILVNEIESLDEKVVNGIIIPAEGSSDRGIHPRWAKVAKVGPEQNSVLPGQWILVDHGRWTRGIKLNDDKVYRKIENKSILLVSDEKPENIHTD